MFGGRFFGARFFGPRYWGKVGADPVPLVGVLQMITLQRLGENSR